MRVASCGLHPRWRGEARIPNTKSQTSFIISMTETGVGSLSLGSFRLVARERSAHGGLSVCFPPVADMEDADDARRDVVLVYHTVVANPDPMHALSPGQLRVRG